jgi:hypothetical protein
MDARLQIAGEKISAIGHLTSRRIKRLDFSDASEGDPVTVGNCLEFQCEAIEVRFDFRWWMDCIVREFDNLHDFSFVVSVEHPARAQAINWYPNARLFFLAGGKLDDYHSLILNRSPADLLAGGFKK